MTTVAITSIVIVSFLILFYRAIRSESPQKDPDFLEDYYMDMATPPSIEYPSDHAFVTKSYVDSNVSEEWINPDSKRITDGFGVLPNKELLTYIETITEGTLSEVDGAFITLALLELQLRGIDFE